MSIVFKFLGFYLFLLWRALTRYVSAYQPKKRTNKVPTTLLTSEAPITFRLLLLTRWCEGGPNKQNRIKNSL